MKVDIKAKGLDELFLKFQRFPEKLEAVTERVLKQAGRALVVECARRSGKAPLTENAGKNQENQIQNEIKGLFPKRSEGWTVYNLIKAKSDLLAAQYYAAFKSGNVEFQEAIIRKSRIKKAIDVSSHKRHRGARTSKRAPIAVVADSRQSGYIKQRIKTAGLVRGGWYAAGKSLGGSQRTRTPEGKSIQSFPHYIRRHGRKASLGGSAYRSGRMAALRIYNNVRYVGEVLPSDQLKMAVSGMDARLAKAFLKEMQYINRRK